jgi:hypothetical protein
VELVDYADNDGPTSTVILTGAVDDAGKAQSVGPDGTVDPEHRSQLNLMLAQGSFRLDIAVLDKSEALLEPLLSPGQKATIGALLTQPDTPDVKLPQATSISRSCAILGRCQPTRRPTTRAPTRNGPGTTRCS